MTTPIVNIFGIFSTKQPNTLNKLKKQRDAVQYSVLGYSSLSQPSQTIRALYYFNPRQNYYIHSLLRHYERLTFVGGIFFDGNKC